MKIHSLKNDHLSISVQQEGAELCSIKDVRSGTEYLWQADPEIWASHAPNLFPVIGVLKEGKFQFQGKEYKMPKHGFVRYNREITLKQKTGTQLIFQLLYSKESLKHYPFKFAFEISFTLNGKILEVAHKVRNLDEKTIYFSLGGHPAFNVPLFPNEDYEDYFLEFDHKLNLETYLLSDQGLLTNATKPILKENDHLSLHKKLFDNDALVFKDIASKQVSLKSRKSGPILSLVFEDFKNLGIWAKPAAPFVCIEPWLGIADHKNSTGDITEKEGILNLHQGQDFMASYAIEIHR